MNDLKIFDENGKPLQIEDILATFPWVNLLKCNRVDVIDETGRAYVNWKDENKVAVALQDEGRTLKVFIQPKE